MPFENEIILNKIFIQNIRINIIKLLIYQR